MELPNEHEVENCVVEIAKQCRELLQISTLHQVLMQYEWAENRLADFKLWTEGSGLFATGDTSLNARLSLEPGTTSLLTSMLNVLKDNIEKCILLAGSHYGMLGEMHHVDSEDMQFGALDPMSRPFSPWSDSSHSESETESEAEPDLLAINMASTLGLSKHKVEQILKQLSRLSSAIHWPKANSNYQKADRMFKVEDHQAFFHYLSSIVLVDGGQEEAIRDNQTSKRLSPIQERLIISNLRRRNRLQYVQRQSKNVIFGGTTTPRTLPTENKNTRVESAGRESMSIPREGLGQEQVGLAPAATAKLAIERTMNVTSKQTSTYSERTSTTVHTPNEVDYPHPPIIKQSLEKFQCPYCYQVLPSTCCQVPQWRKHLAADICPYTCVIEDCPYPGRLYVSRNDWLQHVQDDHPQCWECLPCQISKKAPLLFASIDEFLNHIEDEHGASITEDQYSTLISAAARPIPFGINQCPLCDETGPVDSDALIDHILEHVHAFSLQSLSSFQDECGTDNQSNFSVTNNSCDDSDDQPDDKDLIADNTVNNSALESNIVGSNVHSDAIKGTDELTPSTSSQYQARDQQPTPEYELHEQAQYDPTLLVMGDLATQEDEADQLTQIIPNNPSITLDLTKPNSLEKTTITSWTCCQCAMPGLVWSTTHQCTEIHCQHRRCQNCSNFIDTVGPLRGPSK